MYLWLSYHVTTWSFDKIEREGVLFTVSQKEKPQNTLLLMHCEKTKKKRFTRSDNNMNSQETGCLAFR